MLRNGDNHIFQDFIITNSQNLQPKNIEYSTTHDQQKSTNKKYQKKKIFMNLEINEDEIKRERFKDEKR